MAIKKPSLFYCFILVIVAALIKRSLQVFLFIYSSFRALFKGELDKYWWNLAVSIDCNGNAIGEYFWNDFLILKSGYEYGNRKESISSATGKNEVKNTLRVPGKILRNTLNSIQKDHCSKAIDNAV